MRVIPPIQVTDLTLTSSSCNEPHSTEQAYNSGTTYAKGDKVIVGAPSSTVTISIASPAVVTWASHGLPDATPVYLTTTGALPTGLTASQTYYVVNSVSGAFQLSERPDGAPIRTSGSQSGTHTAHAFIHRTYESVQASNTGHNPPTDDGTWWLDIGPTNRWAMFDVYRTTRTVDASPLEVTVTAGERVDAVGVVGIIGDSVEIEVVVDAVTVYTNSRELSTRDVVSWYDYFFTPFTYRESAAFFDLPPYTAAEITVRVIRATGDAGCGGVILGRSAYLGVTVNNAVSDAQNFSTINRDEFGNATLIPRRTVPRLPVTVIADRAAVNKIRSVREALNAEPALWSGLDDQDDQNFEAVLIMGIYKQFSISLDQPAPGYAAISLELEEI